jgi:hypothetical protein
LLQRYHELFPDNELNVLLSYGTRSSDYYDLIYRSRHLINSLIADSGAFTKNFSQTAKSGSISLPGYIKFLKETSGQFDFCFNYDEDFTLEGFDTNTPMMELIESHGHKVVPVVHDYIGEKREEVEFYIDKQYPIIALGYSPHKQANKIGNLKIAVKKALAANIKIHLLGLTSIEIFQQIPVHYSDSSSWSQYTKFGYTVWLRKVGDKAIIEKIRYEDTTKHPKDDRKDLILSKNPLRDEFLQYVKDELNLSYQDLYGQDYHMNRNLVNVHFFVMLQDEVRKIQQELIKTFEWRTYFGFTNDIAETMKGDFDQDFLNDAKTLLDL